VKKFFSLIALSTLLAGCGPIVYSTGPQSAAEARAAHDKAETNATPIPTPTPYVYTAPDEDRTSFVTDWNKVAAMATPVPVARDSGDTPAEHHAKGYAWDPPNMNPIPDAKAVAKEKKAWAEQIASDNRKRQATNNYLYVLKHSTDPVEIEQAAAAANN
jgi:hypothetical protein